MCGVAMCVGVTMCSPSCLSCDCFAQKHGFVAAKIPCAFGPSHGDEGLAKNVEIFRGFREQVGPDFPLM